MDQVLVVLRHDARRLRGALVLWLLLGLVSVALRVANLPAPVLADTLRMVMQLGIVVLAGLVVVADPPSGSDALWRTHPLRSSAVVTAKLAFVGLWVCAPIAFGQWLVALDDGMSVSHQISVVVQTVFWAAALSAGAMLVASCTRRATQFLTVAVVVVVGYSLLRMWIARLFMLLRTQDTPAWAAWGPVPAPTWPVYTVAVGLVATAAALVLFYRTHRFGRFLLPGLAAFTLLWTATELGAWVIRPATDVAPTAPPDPAVTLSPTRALMPSGVPDPHVVAEVSVEAEGYVARVYDVRARLTLPDGSVLENHPDNVIHQDRGDVGRIDELLHAAPHPGFPAGLSGATVSFDVAYLSDRQVEQFRDSLVRLEVTAHGALQTHRLRAVIPAGSKEMVRDGMGWVRLDSLRAGPTALEIVLTELRVFPSARAAASLGSGNDIMFLRHPVRREVLSLNESVRSSGVGGLTLYPPLALLSIPQSSQWTRSFRAGYPRPRPDRPTFRGGAEPTGHAALYTWVDGRIGPDWLRGAELVLIGQEVVSGFTTTVSVDDRPLRDWLAPDRPRGR